MNTSSNVSHAGLDASHIDDSTHILAAPQILKIMVLQFLLQRQIIEFPPKRKLAIDLFLLNAEVDDVEEADMLGSILEFLHQLLFPSRLVEETEIDRYQLGPIEIIFRLRDLVVWFQRPAWHLGLLKMDIALSTLASDGIAEVEMFESVRESF